MQITTEISRLIAIKKFNHLKALVYLCVFDVCVCELTAIVFSLIPPTGSILPVSDTSPVMATFWRTGWLVARDNSAVTIVQPALGPSFGVAP